MQLQLHNQTAPTTAFTAWPISHRPTCIAIVWLKDRFPRNVQTALLTSVRIVDGVSSAQFSSREPSLMIVDYDHARTSAQHILRRIRAMGAEAKLVGC